MVTQWFRRELNPLVARHIHRSGMRIWMSTTRLEGNWCHTATGFTFDSNFAVRVTVHAPEPSHSHIPVLACSSIISHGTSSPHELIRVAHREACPVDPNCSEAYRTPKQLRMQVVISDVDYQSSTPVI